MLCAAVPKVRFTVRKISERLSCSSSHNSKMTRRRKPTMRPVDDSDDEQLEPILPDEVVRITHISRLPSGNLGSRFQAVSLPALATVGDTPPSQPKSNTFDSQDPEYEPLPTLDSRDLPDDMPWIDPEYEHFLDDTLPFQPPRPKRASVSHSIILPFRNSWCL